MLFALLAAALAADDLTPELGAGLILQGIRPGAVVEYVVPFAAKQKKRKTRTHVVVPTVSGWVHPSHYMPLQAHVHYGTLDRNTNGFVLESTLGVGVTYVMNARPTFEVDGDRLRRVPLAGAAVFSPGVGFGVGSSGEKRTFLVRGRLNPWIGWQHSLALSWNLELVLRSKMRKSP